MKGLRKTSAFLLSAVGIPCFALGLASCKGWNNGTRGLEYDTELFIDYAVVKGIGKSTATEIEIASSYHNRPVTIIGEEAFRDCTSIESVTIPDSVTDVQNGAFNGCTSLKTVRLPSGITKIKSRTFSGCSSLTSIRIPDKVNKIGDGAFLDCASLADISVPDRVIEIEERAFGNTAYYGNEANWEGGLLYIGSHLIQGRDDVSGEVTLKEGIKTVAEAAFKDCASLESVIISDGVVMIGEYAFKDCAALKNLTLPRSVRVIGDSAFDGCSLLESITYLGSKRDWREVSQDDAWDHANGITIVCTDGTIQI